MGFTNRIINKMKDALQGEKVSRITIILVVYDILAVNASYFFALLLRFDFIFSKIDQKFLDGFFWFAPIYTFVCIVLFIFLRLYRSVWRFASYIELERVTISSLISSLFMVGTTILWGIRMPISYYIMGGIMQFVAILSARFAYRFVLLLREGRGLRNYGKRKDDARIMLIGAGAAGRRILRDIKRSPDINGRVMVIIDDNEDKWEHYIDGVLIAGGRDSILENVDKYNVNKIFLAIPSASPQDRRDILNICQQTDCELRNLPNMYQLLLGKVSVNAMKKVSVEDLLGRDPIRTDMREVYEFVNNKVVLVTGGGGSIGSELCRQIAAHGPKQLIIFDVYENNAYEIQNELRENYINLNLVTLIGSVRDSRKMYQVFEKYHPDIVYHAAAHKHVPLMEDSPCEAIKNNAIGTYKTAYAAMTHGCKRFVLISTDKAVNPTNVMGASKRLCEMIIQSFDYMIKAGRASEIPQIFTHLGEENADKDGTGSVFLNIETQFVAVRFGNVLGSNGSVIPLFRKQIEKGGPVTVTHPDIIRYFMTIPEAVGLVMLAGTYAKGGEIFVLDMGSPVKIVDLAKNLIRQMGLKVDEDIKIQFTGLRPGEKLYEEKLMAEEGLKTTENELIHIGQPIPFDVDLFLKQLESLMDLAYANKEEKMIVKLKEMVSTYVSK